MLRQSTVAPKRRAGKKRGAIEAPPFSRSDPVYSDFSSYNCPIEMIYITIESIHPELSEKCHVCILLRFWLWDKWPKVKISPPKKSCRKFNSFVPHEVPLPQALPYLIRTHMVCTTQPYSNFLIWWPLAFKRSSFKSASDCGPIFGLVLYQLFCVLYWNDA